MTNQGMVPRKMVKNNPGLRQILSKVFLSMNMQLLELTKDSWAFTPRYGYDCTKCYSKQYMGRKNTKMGHFKSLISTNRFFQKMGPGQQ